MNSSFYNGVSGIKTQQFGIDIQANNISNISTIGFKGSTPEFSSLFATTLSDSYFDSTSNNVGFGSKASTTALNMEQGILQGTDNIFDLALNSEGWFGVKSVANETLYTRAGAFSVDTNGNMVDVNGNYLLGTSGENITPTTISQEKLENFGIYYNGNTREFGTPYAITDVDNIEITQVSAQETINLPDMLYYPPVATTYINYQANLNPKIEEKSTHTTLNSSDLTSFIDVADSTIDISGTLTNATNLDNPKTGDVVNITLTDANNKSIEVSTSLDSSLSFSLIGADTSTLDQTSITVNSEINLYQEIPNVEHFTTEVISPTGDKNFLDMTFTKRTPQDEMQTTWDAQIQLLNYYEDYEIETYNPTKSYDNTVYNVDLETNQVTKIYDPTLYKVDTGTNKVYEIIDEQIGNATFSGGGELLESNMPTMSNAGTPLSINIGDPYEQINIDTPTVSIANNQISFEGTESGLEEGKQINVKFTDPDGFERTASGKVNADGSWSATQKYNFTDAATDISAYNIVYNGYDGMISHVDLDKSRIAEKDGKVEGYLKDYGMDGNGNVIAEFTNGESSAVAKIAVYHFQNDQGLETVGSTLFKESVNSGDPIFYTDVDGNYIHGSQILSNRLESSNVSMATALTELIIIQKAFDASAKSITTSDEMIQNAINMKQ